MIDIVLIGLGAWGNNFLRLLFSNQDKFNLVATVDIGKQSKFAIKHYRSLESLLESNISFDAAIVATPSSTHFSIVKKLIENKIHCLVEKPLTLNFQNTEKLLNLSKKNNVQLMVDHTFLYDPSTKFVKKIIEKEKLGKLIHMSFERTNFGPIRYDVNANWDLATHDISILSAIFDFLPNNISSSGLSTLNKNIVDIVSTNMYYKDVFVTIMTSWLHPEKTRKVKIVGSEKMLVWDLMLPDQEIRIFDKSVENDSGNNNDIYTNLKSVRNGKVLIPYLNKEEPLKNVLLDFKNRIDNKSSNNLNNEDSVIRTIKTMELIEKAMVTKNI